MQIKVKGSFLTYTVRWHFSHRSDYQAWHGPNPENASGHSKVLAQGPKRDHLRGPSGLARGQDPSMRKGPQGLAKGSQFTQGIKKESCFSTKVL